MGFDEAGKCENHGPLFI